MNQTKNLFLQIGTMILVVAILVGAMIVIFPPQSKKTIATVDDHKITLDDFRQIFDYYANYFGITDPADEAQAQNVTYLRDMIIDMLIDEAVQMNQAKALGIDVLTEAEQADLVTEVDEIYTAWREELEHTALQMDATLTGDALAAKVEELLNDYIAESGMNRDRLIKQLTTSLVIDRVYKESTKDLTVDPAAVQTMYDDRLEEIKGIYADDPATFETDYVEGTALYYQPAGYRQAKHILTRLTDEQMASITSLRSAGKTAEADAARDAALLTIQAKAQAALNQVKADGSNFDAMVTEHSQDKVLTNPTKSFAVHKEGQYTKEFVNALFALKEGKVSGLVPTDYGYHIIYYVAPIAEGPIPFDQVKESLTEETLAEQKEAAYSTLLSTWREAAKVSLYLERITYFTPKPTPKPTATPKASPAQ